LKLNADVGEGLGNEALLMPWLDMANIACGGHAGNVETMREVMLLAKKHAVVVGAHPSYPDRANFGRSSLSISHRDLRQSLLQQLQLFETIAQQVDIDVDYVKPHGALYNDMMTDAALLDLIVECVAEVFPSKQFMLLASHAHELSRQATQKHGLHPIFEVFADRAYQADGALVSRNRHGAVLDQQQVIERFKILLARGVIIAEDGTELSMPMDSVCVHGDSPAALDMLIHLSGFTRHG
jgi:UPF0271 protein